MVLPMLSARSPVDPPARAADSAEVATADGTGATTCL